MALVRSLQRLEKSVCFLFTWMSLTGGSLGFAMGGRLHRLEFVQNWKTDHPQVVVAFGMLESPSLLKHYDKQFKSYFKDGLQKIDPRIEIKVIQKARGREVVQVLKDPNTVGLVFISHSYSSREPSGDAASIALGADGFALPTKIFSAATPALRFGAIFGCHGKGFRDHYEVETAFAALPGSHVFFSNEDEYLHVDPIFHGAIKRLERDMLSSLQSFTQEALTGGIEPPKNGDGAVTISAKDIAAFREPRYVYVNDHIVGVLGSDPDNSNLARGYRNFRFKVPALALQTRSHRNKVAIRAADVSPRFMVDNYLINSVRLETPQRTVTQHYMPAWRFGERDLRVLPDQAEQPWNDEVSLKDALKSEMEIREAHAKYLAYMKEYGRDLPDFPKSKGDYWKKKLGIDLPKANRDFIYKYLGYGESPEEEQFRNQAEGAYYDFISKQLRSTERLDHDQRVWAEAEFKGRSYFDDRFER